MLEAPQLLSSGNTVIWRIPDGGRRKYEVSSPFQLRIRALQKTGGEYGEEKNYVFGLKRRLAPAEYDFIWVKKSTARGPVRH